MLSFYCFLLFPPWYIACPAGLNWLSSAVHAYVNLAFYLFLPHCSLLATPKLKSNKFSLLSLCVYVFLLYIYIWVNDGDRVSHFEGRTTTHAMYFAVAEMENQPQKAPLQQSRVFWIFTMVHFPKIPTPVAIRHQNSFIVLRRGWGAFFKRCSSLPTHCLLTA